MVDMEQQKMALGCDTTSCLAELGGALGVPYLIESSVSRVGERYVLTLKILAVEDAKVMARKVAMVGQEAQLIASLETIIPEALNALAAALRAAAPGASQAPPTTRSVAASKRRSSVAGWVVGGGLLVVLTVLTLYTGRI